MNWLKLAWRTGNGIYLANKIAATIAAVALSSIVLITLADVVGRYFFNTPVQGAWEIVGLLMICAGTWGWGYCQMSKSHITVTVVTNHLSGRVRAGIKTFAYLIGLIGFTLISWQTFLLAKKYYFLKHGNETLTIGIPFAPFMLMMSISTGLMALVLIVDIVQSIKKVSRHESD